MFSDYSSQIDFSSKSEKNPKSVQSKDENISVTESDGEREAPKIDIIANKSKFSETKDDAPYSKRIGSPRAEIFKPKTETVVTKNKEEDEELAIFLTMEKEVLQEELKSKGIETYIDLRRSLTGATAKAEQNMENMLCSQLLNLNDGKLDQSSGDIEFIDEEEEKGLNNDDPLRKW